MKGEGRDEVRGRRPGETMDTEYVIFLHLCDDILHAKAWVSFIP